MKIALEKSSGKSKCRNKDCKKKPDFISDTGRIKSQTTCVAMTMESAAGFNTSYYCRDCIEQLYSDLKKVLNPALWVFH
jgi:hypothetical protein